MCNNFINSFEYFAVFFCGKVNANAERSKTKAKIHEIRAKKKSIFFL